MCRRLGRRIVQNFKGDDGIPRPHFGTVTSVGVGRNVFGITYEDGDQEDYCESPACSADCSGVPHFCVVLCAAAGELKARLDKTARWSKKSRPTSFECWHQVKALTYSLTHCLSGITYSLTHCLSRSITLALTASRTHLPSY